MLFYWTVLSFGVHHNDLYLYHCTVQIFHAAFINVSFLNVESVLNTELINVYIFFFQILVEYKKQKLV